MKFMLVVLALSGQVGEEGKLMDVSNVGEFNDKAHCEAAGQTLLVDFSVPYRCFYKGAEGNPTAETQKAP